MKKYFISIFLLFSACLCGREQMLLRENLKKANVGDFIVTAQNKNYTLLHIYDKTEDTLVIEEITIPERTMTQLDTYWTDWIEENAPGNTSWVMYEIHLETGEMLDYFSFSKNCWFDIPEADNFITTLINLRLTKIPIHMRKRIGSKNAIWQPVMVVNGEKIRGVFFDAWKTYWPNDGTELSGKTIEVYTPVEDDLYPSYFPYWLQISGLIGKAKVRIVDSGSNLKSPKPHMLRLSEGQSP